MILDVDNVDKRAESKLNVSCEGREQCVVAYQVGEQWMKQ